MNLLKQSLQDLLGPKVLGLCYALYQKLGLHEL